MLNEHFFSSTNRRFSAAVETWAMMRLYMTFLIRLPSKNLTAEPESQELAGVHIQTAVYSSTKSPKIQGT